MTAPIPEVAARLAKYEALKRGDPNGSLYGAYPDAEEWVDAVKAHCADLRALLTDHARLRDACVRQNNEITQTLGQALGYPWFKDDPKNFPDTTEADGVCVGEHVAESLADEAAARIASLTEERDRLAVALEPFVKAWNSTGVSLPPNYPEEQIAGEARDKLHAEHFQAARAALTQPEQKDT